VKSIFPQSIVAFSRKSEADVEVCSLLDIVRHFKGKSIGLINRVGLLVGVSHCAE
jgi:hypothetical protein